MPSEIQVGKFGDHSETAELARLRAELAHASQMVVTMASVTEMMSARLQAQDQQTREARWKALHEAANVAAQYGKDVTAPTAKRHACAIMRKILEKGK